MPELLLELFSEEIPARMQAGGARDLARLMSEALAPLKPADIVPFYGPRRIGLSAQIEALVPAAITSERGPRTAAPEAALAGFLRKHNARREDLRAEGDFWVLEKTFASLPAAELIAERLPPLLRRFPWPKSMRWGGTCSFTWVRPLKRILCLLDGAVVAFHLGETPEDCHGLASANLTEGHRMMAPGAFAVTSAADLRAKLRDRYVILDPAERRSLIEQDLSRAAARQRNLAILEDSALLDEVCGLVEWPVGLIGRIDDDFMDLPPEVMQVSMRVNQRYFATRDSFNQPAPFFAFVANIAAADGGETIIEGNERVLRARFADARHFWDLDRARSLARRVDALQRVIFHARLGTQWERVERLKQLALHLAEHVGADKNLAQRAAYLCKSDLTTGMVGEFPELQGIMGGYYAAHDGEKPEIAAAIREHYSPKGPNDAVPAAPVSIAVALADKLDLLAQFFAIDEKPSGSGDPFALRRAGLGVIRIIRENKLRLALRNAIDFALQGRREFTEDILGFLLERLRVQLRTEGTRHDVLAAIGEDDDITRLLAKVDAITAFLTTEDGTNLLAAYKRTANILRFEEKDGGPTFTVRDGGPTFDYSAIVGDGSGGGVNRNWFNTDEERALASALDGTREIPNQLEREQFSAAMTTIAQLRVPLDKFFDNVRVNDPDPSIRVNRLRLLDWVRFVFHRIADFSRIEG